MSCSKHGDDPAPAADSAVPVDPALLAFLSRARSAHHRADLHEDERPQRAAKALEELIDGPLPEGGTMLPEVREVLADTHARLADLESRFGKYDAARQHIHRGLELAQEISYFRGHLFEVRGLVAERLAAARRREAERLLRTADEQLDGPERAQLDSMRAKLDALRQQLEQDPNAHVRAELATSEQALADLRMAKLPSDRRAKHRSLVREQDAAIASALEAFEESMRIQAQVIEARTQSAFRPTTVPSGAASR